MLVSGNLMGILGTVLTSRGTQSLPAGVESNGEFLLQTEMTDIPRSIGSNQSIGVCLVYGTQVVATRQRLSGGGHNTMDRGRVSIHTVEGLYGDKYDVFPGRHARVLLSDVF